jgi:hypothetical protein
MSSIVLTGDTSGTVTVSAPAVAGTRTITLPAATGTAILEDASNNLQMNSGFGSSATAYGVRAWVNIDGVGTVGINASGNVSSITDVATGAYRVNFTNAMPDTNFVISVTTRVGGYDRTEITARTTTSCDVGSYVLDGSGRDYDPVNVIVVR